MIKKTENWLIGICLMAVIIATGGAIWHATTGDDTHTHNTYTTNKYGAFLAAQHAIYVNDFDNAAKFSQHLADRDISIVQNTVLLADFLNGRLPDDTECLKSEKGSAARLIYDAGLARRGDWVTLYNRHKKDETALAAPLRIWAGVGANKTAEVLKFIDKLKTNESWKSFVRGQIYAETGQLEKAAAQFSSVATDFMNINDYMYIMAFFIHHDMPERAAELREDFTSRPGGMYMLDLKITPNWADYSGIKNALAFGLVQNVSHTQIMMYSDLSLLLLRFAQIIQTAPIGDAMNYYLGQFFYNNGGDYEKHFKAINSNSPFYSFGMTKIAENTGKTIELERAVRANPLFVPAVNKLIAKYVQKGREKRALSVVNRSLDNKNLTTGGRAYFLKSRAQIHLTFGNLSAAQSDIRRAADILPLDAGILAIQSQIWVGQNRDLETAYEYAIALVRKDPTDIMAWDVLGRAVRAREGAPAALEVIERVAQISESCSALFEQLGDLYTELGNPKRAQDAYARAIELSDDGLTILPKLKNKLRKAK